ncbi:MAG: PEP-CTERM sorting domain-containing protein [Okeania sp. SIO2C9]|uniref:PEP-CTERM sorting domain-containing protein n=1 Tax=Okeania sp. SIO2C9 TaxID=2607791 RepID=UPI0013C1E752|nr:PEP-CTERM sorting domain-containing protein [Okeania sp. SIO2C9]NEQ72367.1 PEP-CTERM sorting domain-containing protein [Okeania sp. SIO2C9]
MFKKVSIATASATLATLSTFSGASAIVNGSFENGFTGWSTIGDTSIEDSSFGTAPSDGNFNALMNSDFGVSESELEAFLGLGLGDIDSSLNIDATIGSGIKQTIFAEAGDTLTFDFNFLTNEFTPEEFFNDSAFVSITSLELLADTNSNFVTSMTPVSEETGYQSFSFTFSETANYTLGFGVVNVGDTIVNSGLLIDNVELTASTPEPTTILSLFTTACGAFSLLKRNQKKEV